MNLGASTISQDVWNQHSILEMLMLRNNFIRKSKLIGKILIIWKMAFVIGLILKTIKSRSTTSRVAQVLTIVVKTFVSTLGISSIGRA